MAVRGSLQNRQVYPLRNVAERATENGFAVICLLLVTARWTQAWTRSTTSLGPVSLSFSLYHSRNHGQNCYHIAITVITLYKARAVTSQSVFIAEASPPGFRELSPVARVHLPNPTSSLRLSELVKSRRHLEALRRYQVSALILVILGFKAIPLPNCHQCVLPQTRQD